MEDLLLLVFGALVVGFLIFVALCLAAVGAAVGSIVVGVGGAWEFVVSLARRVRGRGGADRRVLPPEPAFELYVLGRFAWSGALTSGRDSIGLVQVHYWL